MNALLVALIALTACERQSQRTRVILASTTSTEDTGLFGELIPAFEKAHPEFKVFVVAVGTGQALELGRRKDADVVLVHAPPAESAFIAQGHAKVRCQVMQNDFVIAGPGADPARLAGTRSAADAFRKIASAGASFVSRGDDSGTHQKERIIWKQIGIEPQGPWYASSGQGMAETLLIVAEKQAYTLTDRASFITTKTQVPLTILVEGDPALINQYSVIPVIGSVNERGGEAFARWVTDSAAQNLIGRFGRDRYSRPLFDPNASTCSIARD